MTTVLITQCLQRDFVDPIGPQDPLPNMLHVGYTEATRLLGPDPAAGPMAQLIDWTRSLAGDAIDLIHIRDWHDPADPAQREHLLRFGPHCIKGSDGARLILGMDEQGDDAGNVRVVDSLTLNDFEGTDLALQLEPMDRAIVAYLFRDSTEVHLEPLTGGFSKAKVWRATSQDALGHHQAPAVVKLGAQPPHCPRAGRLRTGRRGAWQQRSACPWLCRPGDRAGLKYSYAGHGSGRGASPSSRCSPPT